jgi:hypothetical protein
MRISAIRTVTINRKSQVPKQPQPAKVLLNPFHTGDQPQKRHQEAANTSGMYKIPAAPKFLQKWMVISRIRHPHATLYKSEFLRGL